MILTFQGLFVVGGGGVEAGGREGEGCSFISFCPAYALASAASTPHLLIVFKGRGGQGEGGGCPPSRRRRSWF